MAGRDTFKKYSTIINISVSIFRLVPKFIKIFIWDSIKLFSQLPFIGLRFIILKSLCKSCGDNIRIGANVTILNWDKISLGSNVSVHDNCYIDGAGGLYIEENVSIAHNSSILSTNHSWDDSTVPIKYNPVIFGKVIIKNDVWVGCGCRILSNVEIGSRSIIAAGAVVTTNVKPNTIYGGIPAKFIKDI